MDVVVNLARQFLSRVGEERFDVIARPFPRDGLGVPDPSAGTLNVAVGLLVSAGTHVAVRDVDAAITCPVSEGVAESLAGATASCEPNY